jgi:hypothetical protein
MKYCFGFVHVDVAATVAQRAVATFDGADDLVDCYCYNGR